jgi:hypothetical protein
MALQMNEAQRQATTGLIEQSRQQQVVGILADRSYGQSVRRAFRRAARNAIYSSHRRQQNIPARFANRTA